MALPTVAVQTPLVVTLGDVVKTYDRVFIPHCIIHQNVGTGKVLVEAQIQRCRLIDGVIDLAPQPPIVMKIADLLAEPGIGTPSGQYITAIVSRAAALHLI